MLRLSPRRFLSGLLLNALLPTPMLAQPNLVSELAAVAASADARLGAEPQPTIGRPFTTTY